MTGGDSVAGNVGEDARNVAMGKDIGQDNRAFHNGVNIRIDERPPFGRPDSDLYGRLDDLEMVVYGQERFNVPGLLRQQNYLFRWIVINTALLAATLITLFLSMR